MESGPKLHCYFLIMQTLVTHLIFLSFSVAKLDPIGFSQNQTAHPPMCSICLSVGKLVSQVSPESQKAGSRLDLKTVNL